MLGDYVPLILIPILGAAMWVLGVVLASKLEAEVGWRRRAWRCLDRCPVCRYSYVGLAERAPCPECGHGRGEPVPIVVPVRWLWTIALVAMLAPAGLNVLGLGRLGSAAPLEELLWSWMLGGPGLLLASGVLACLWPCGARMRWSMAIGVLVPEVALLAIALAYGCHDATAHAGLLRFVFSSAVAVMLVPALLCIGIVVGFWLNRIASPARPGLS